MYTYFTFISIVDSLTKATHPFHIIQLYLQFEIVEFGFSRTELSMAFLFSNLGEELLSQSEFTVVQTQHLHSAKQMGHLRRRRWSRGGGTGTNSLCISFLLTISKYICTCFLCKLLCIFPFNFEGQRTTLSEKCRIPGWSAEGGWQTRGQEQNLFCLCKRNIDFTPAWRQQDTNSS